MQDTPRDPEPAALAFHELRALRTPGLSSTTGPDDTHPGARVVQPALGPLAWVFARFGNSVVGGGSATVAILEQEMVDRRHWLDRSDSQLAFAVAGLTPGTNLFAFCAAAGWLMHRHLGAAVALAAASLPCSIAVVALTIFYTSWTEHALARLALRGALASAVAIVVSTCWILVRPHLAARHQRRTVFFFVLALFLAIAGISPIRILMLSAGAGALWPAGEER